ncbi:type II toxin-antitoxin system Phd/YefM family antitoxin [Streptomyces synnematoformans]|uniref:Antitoxin n=1 Tax=Streptomyces synnematoformans TaxID=415721 RepID=A0ABN2YF22_9ACTN
MKRLGIAEARARFGELCRGAAVQRERTVITDHGTPVAVLLSPAELADLEDRAALAHNRVHPEQAQDFDAFLTELRAG